MDMDRGDMARNKEGRRMVWHGVDGMLLVRGERKRSAGAGRWMRADL